MTWCGNQKGGHAYIKRAEKYSRWNYDRLKYDRCKIAVVNMTVAKKIRFKYNHSKYDRCNKSDR